jgi:hypothetical protein
MKKGRMFVIGTIMLLLPLILQVISIISYLKTRNYAEPQMLFAWSFQLAYLQILGFVLVIIANGEAKKQKLKAEERMLAEQFRAQQAAAKQQTQTVTPDSTPEADVHNQSQ